MTKILLNSGGFFHILPFSYRGKNVRRRKITKFWLGEENFSRQKISPEKIFSGRVIVFPKSVGTPSKICTVISFYVNPLKRFPEKCFRV